MSKKKAIDLAEISALSYEDVGKLVEVSLFTPAGMLMNEDSNKNLNYVSVTPGAQGEGRFGVVPVPVMLQDGRMVLAFPPPRDLVENFPGGRGLAITDDAACTPPAIQAAQLDFTQRRRIGTHYMGRLVRVIGATNSIEDSAGGWDVAPAWANRMGWLKWPDPPADIFARYLQMEAEALEGEHIFGLPLMLDGPPGGSKTSFMMGLARKWFERDDKGVVAAEAEEERVLGLWADAWALASQHVAGFVLSHPSMLRRQPQAGDPTASRAWASPRTVEMAARAYAASKVYGLTPVQTNGFVAAFVGGTWANEFETYVVNADLPDPRKFLESRLRNDPIFAHTRTRLDRTTVVLQSCVALVSQLRTADKKDLAGALWGWMGELQNECADLLAPAVQMLWKSKLVGMPEARPVLAAMEPVVNATRR